MSVWVASLGPTRYKVGGAQSTLQLKAKLRSESVLGADRTRNWNYYIVKDEVLQLLLLIRSM